jgi:hypothetical protein
MKVPSLNIVDFSDEESDIENALLAVHPRVNGVNGAQELNALDESEEEEQESDDDGWDAESLFEDAIEEMGDEHLFNGGERPETP